MVRRHEEGTRSVDRQISSLHRKLIELAFEPMFVRQPDGVITEWNRGAQELYGYTQDEAVGAISHELLKTRFPVSLEELVSTLEQTALWFGTLVHTARDGRKISVESRHQLFAFDNVKFVLETNREITAQRALFDHMTEWVNLWQLVRDPAGHIKTWRLVDINPAGLKGWGKTREETIGRTADEIFPGATEHFMPIVQKIFREKAPHTWESYFPETRHYLQMTSVPFGEYFISTGSDITDIRHAEQALRASEQRFRSFFENAAIGAAQINAQGRFIQVNERLSQITGYSRDQLLRMGPLDLDHPDEVEADRRRIEEFFRSKAPYLFYEKRYVHKAGHVIWVRVTAATIRDEHGAVVTTATLIEDINERKVAEEALRLRESEVRTLVENSQDFIVRLDRQARQIYANPATARLYGLPLEEFLGKNLREMGFPEEVWRPALKTCEQVFDTGQAITLEQTHPFGGTSRYFEARHVPEFDSNGSVVTVLVFTREITAHKLAEVALRRERDYIERLLDTVPAIVLLLAPDGTIQHVNNFFESLTGWRFADIQGKEWFATCLPERDRDRIRTLFHIATHGEATRGNVSTIVTRDGSEREIEWYDQRMVDADGTMTGLLAIGLDVTARRAAERALFEIEARAQLALESGEMGAWAWELATGKVVWDDRSSQFFGFTPGSFSGRLQDAIERIHPEDRYRTKNAAKRAIDRNVPIREEFRVVHPGGSVRWLATRAHVLREKGGQAIRVIGVHFDITTRKEDELAREHRHEEQMARLYRIGTVNELASGLAHELSQPLTAIQNYAGGCLKWLDAGGDVNQIRTALNSIYSQSQRVVDIIQHLRRLMTTGDPQRAPTDLNAVVERARELLKVPLARKNVRVELVLAPDLPRIAVDALQVEQVLIILLRNCIDVFAGEYLADPRVEIRTTRHDGIIEVAVRDNGPGVKPDVLPHLFEPFYTTKTQGMGLGLMLARSIVHAHQGKIRAKPASGGGLVVKFTLPVQGEA